jgi:hypothetical protein
MGYYQFSRVDYYRTEEVVQCLWCRQEFDPSKNGAVNIHNMIQHAMSKHLNKNFQVASSKGKATKVTLIGSKVLIGPKVSD